MADAENALQPSKKRAAGRELTRDTPLDDEEDASEVEAGTFKRASDEVLATRRIVKVRRQQTNSAPASNPFAGIRLVAPTDSGANAGEATAETQSAGENTSADDSKGSDGITEDSEKAKDDEGEQPKGVTHQAEDESSTDKDAAEESNADKEHFAGEKDNDDKSELNDDKSKDGNKSESDDKKDAADKSSTDKDAAEESNADKEHFAGEKYNDDKSELNDDKSKDGNKSESEDKKDAADKEIANDADKEQQKDDKGAENDDKKENKDDNDKKADKVEGEEPSADGGTFKSFQQLSSSQNAFTGLAGTGFTTSLFSFGSKDGSALSGGSGSIFGLKNDNPFGLGLSNNGSSGFGASGSSAISKIERSGLALQEVVIETGEENEKVVFNADSVLFEFADGGWKERGKGELKVNVNSGTEKARLLMRSRGNYRLILNARLFPDMKLTNMDKKGVTFACINSATEGKDGLSTFALKFKDGSIVEEFKAAIMAHKGETSTAPNTSENSPKAAV